MSDHFNISKTARRLVATTQSRRQSICDDDDRESRQVCTCTTHHEISPKNTNYEGLAYIVTVNSCQCVCLCSLFITCPTASKTCKIMKMLSNVIGRTTVLAAVGTTYRQTESRTHSAHTRRHNASGAHLGCGGIKCKMATKAHL